jgi:hypothetical protein
MRVVLFVIFLCGGAALAGAEGDPVLVGAGDIADCDTPGAAATAALLDDIAGTVFTAGDNVYPDGTADEFRACYAPTWGRHLARTRRRVTTSITRPAPAPTTPTSAPVRGSRAAAITAMTSAGGTSWR